MEQITEKITNQVLKIIMILDTWLGFASNDNCRLVTWLDNNEYLNFEAGTCQEANLTRVTSNDACRLN